MSMRKKQDFSLAILLAWLSLLMGCAGHDHQHHDEVLPAPGYADSQTKQALKEGNRFFNKQWWRDAEKQYRNAITSMPSLAEAHYNLGLALSKQGKYKESHSHFMRAVKLEPTNPVFRNAPPFRRYEEVPSETELETDAHGGHSH
ncbi:MAG: hypothetical protein NPIRA02_00940 [Nitrospirales bacterium]|nr:MAG: hypothetical protein NPIRA02_00940 [Nitrospirales bacterium]